MVIGNSSKKLELLAFAFRDVGCSLEILLLFDDGAAVF